MIMRSPGPLLGERMPPGVVSAWVSGSVGEGTRVRASRFWSVIALVGLVTACDPAGGIGAPSAGGGGAPSASTGRPAGDTKADTGCDRAAGKAGQLLPDEESAEAWSEPIIRADENPCIPLADLADAVLAFVPAEKDPQSGQSVSRVQKAQFKSSLGDLAGRVLTANELTKCGYETDHLAIAIYQHADYPWSVGVAAVVRGDIDAGVNIAACYIESLVPTVPRDAPAPGLAPEGPRFGLCGNVTRPTARGEVYTVLTAGDSDQMCAFLEGAV
jgi:hypothetical protein